MRPLLLTILLSLWLTLTPALAGRLGVSPEERALLQSRPVLRVALLRAAPPMFMRTLDGEIDGLGLDYLRLATAELGVEIQPVEHVADADLVLGGETLEGYLRTRPLASFPLVLVARSDVAPFTSAAEIDGHRVALGPEAAWHERLHREAPEAIFETYPSHAAALVAVATGAADAYAGNLAVVTYQRERHGLSNLRVCSELGYPSDVLAVSLHPELPWLRPLLDRAIAATPPAARHAAAERWLLPEPPVLPGWVWWLLAGAAAALLLASTAVVVLRRLVRQHTAALEESLAKLSDANQRLAFHVERMPLACIGLTLDGTIREWNPAAASMFGYPASQARGQSCHLLVPEEERQHTRAMLQALLGGRGTLFSTLANRRSDGSILGTEWFCTLLRDGDGEPSGVVAMIHDVTARNRAQSRQQEQISELQAIFHELLDPLLVCDLQARRAIFLNPAAEALYGADWQDKTCHELLSGAGREPCPSCLIGEPAPETVEFYCERTGRWYEGRQRMLAWPDGRQVRLEIAHDVTAHKETERLKDEMISSVSHEMRTPLTAMLGYVDFLLDNPVEPAQQREFLQTIAQQTERLAELIDNILSLQRYTASSEAAEKDPIEPKAMLGEVFTLYRRASDAHPMRLEADPDLPIVLADSAALWRALCNLVSNAIKYSPAGGEVVLGGRAEAGGALLYVRDHGLGIPAQDRKRVFERFTRLERNDAPRVPGAGLGLALVAETAKAHGGHVWCESEEGQGSTFYLWLPAAPDEDGSEPTAREAQAPSAAIADPMAAPARGRHGDSL